MTTDLVQKQLYQQLTMTMAIGYELPLKHQQLNITSAPSLQTFNKRLKPFLFSASFPS